MITLVRKNGTIARIKRYLYIQANEDIVVQRHVELSVLFFPRQFWGKT